MKKFFFFFCMILLSGTASAGCCVISEQKCTYYDFGDWSMQESFCSSLALKGMNAQWYADCSLVRKISSCSKNCATPIIFSSDRNKISSCDPDWRCTAWSYCVDSVKTRLCIDYNDCGLENPATHMSCDSQAVNLQAAQGSSGANSAGGLTELIVAPQAGFYEGSGTVWPLEILVAGLAILVMVIILLAFLMLRAGQAA